MPERLGVFIVMKELILDFVPGEKHKIYKNNYEYLSEEFRHKIFLINKYLECKNNGDFDSNKDAVLAVYSRTEAVLELKIRASKLKNTDEKFNLRDFKEKFSLNTLEYFCLIISMLYYSDNIYKKLLLQIENTDTLTYSAILKLYFFVEDITEIEDYYSTLEFMTRNIETLCFVHNKPEIDPRVYENLVYNNKNINIPGINIYNNNNSITKKLVIRENISQNIYNMISNTSENLYFYVHGEFGIGKDTIIRRVCDMLNKNLVCVNIPQKTELLFGDYIMTACREAVINNNYMNLYNIDKIIDTPEGFDKVRFAIETARKFSQIIFLVSEKNINLSQKFTDLEYIDINLPELNNTENYKLWNYYLKNYINNTDIHELANKFTFTPAQIQNTVKQTFVQTQTQNLNKINKNIISQCAYNQVSSDFSNKASIIRKKHTWDELVLDPKQKNIIKHACNQIKFKHIVYDKWGLNSRILYGTGLSMLFAGPSGTGKTMAAQVVAHELDMEIYRVDLSQVISKYIGESEKNIKEVFENAKKNNSILLFDETDSIFAKRTEIKDSHDRNANLETSYLLQKMEEHTGITIMTTNFLQNIDQAFFRRINYVVHFALPDYNHRKQIWEKIYPKTVPVTDNIDFDFLAKNFEISGGNIKNIALLAAFMAASEPEIKNQEVSMKHILKSLEHELKKQNKMISKDDFGKYAYLV